MLEWLLVKMDAPEIIVFATLVGVLFWMGYGTSHEAVRAIYFCTAIFSILHFLIAKTPVG